MVAVLISSHEHFILLSFAVKKMTLICLHAIPPSVSELVLSYSYNVLLFIV